MQAGRGKTPNQSPLAQRPQPPVLPRNVKASPRRCVLTRKASRPPVRDVAACITSSISKLLESTNESTPSQAIAFVPALTLRSKALRLLKPRLNRTTDTLNDTEDSTNSRHSVRTPARRKADAASTFESLKLPIAPETALALFRANLTEFEQKEAAEYPRIYYLGLKARKVNPMPVLPHNLGLDNERGDLIFVQNDHIAYRYEALEILGKGSFGQVFKCVDHKLKQFVALKVIRNKKRFKHQATVEMRVLQRMMEADLKCQQAVVRMKGSFQFRSHFCISFELLDANLYQVVKAGAFQGLTAGLVRRIAWQIVGALHFLRELDIIHCDLKPENILLVSANRSAIKIIDFGASCFSSERLYTYIQSRFYRAPEIMLGISYTAAIDVWSLGCILVELTTGRPLFTGENEFEQMLRIVEVLGVPDSEVLDAAPRKSLFFDTDNVPRPGKKVRVPGSRPLRQILATSEPAFLSFLQRCLDWSPSGRAAPAELLQHTWLAQCRQTPAVRLRRTFLR